MTLGSRFGRLPRVLVFIAGLALLSGCLTPPPTLRDPVTFSSPDLATIRPVEVVVLPVKAAVPMPRERIKQFRRESYLRLIEHKFTPVALDYVDDVLREAQLADPQGFESVDSVLPRFREDAVLAITVRSWNVDRLAGEGLVFIGADAILFERATGNRIWMALIDREISVRGVQFSGADRGQAVAWAVAQFTRDLFAALPDKTPPEGVRLPQDPPPAEARAGRPGEPGEAGSSPAASTSR